MPRGYRPDRPRAPNFLMSPSVDPLDGPLRAIEDRLSQLTDLFQRRLLEDRDRRRVLDALHDELEEARKAARGEQLMPILRELLVLVDRLDAYEGVDSGFVISVRDEVLEILRRQGVEELPVGPSFDATDHEAARMEPVEDPTQDGAVVSVDRRGFRRDSHLIRPARVVVGQWPAADRDVPDA